MDSAPASSRVLALATSLAVAFSGCSSARDAQDPPATTPTTEATPTADRPSPTDPPEAVQLAFQRPDPLCPPASALEIAPPAGDHLYELTDPHLSDTELERNDRYHVWCTYQHVEAGEHGDDAVLADHVLITLETRLFRAWGDSTNRDFYPALPLESDNLDDWRVAVGSSRDTGVWWEGCGTGEPCAEGAEPTVETWAWDTQFEGHVGNLEFYVHIVYIAELLPADTESRTIEIFRDLLPAVMDSYERAG